jgi:formamidopyrimidine-DNA glycosylase
MPELPEVENVALALRQTLLGKRLDRIDVRYAGALKPSPRAVRRAVIGSLLTGVTRHGKYLFLDFESEKLGPAQLLLHLRMTGQVFVDPEYKPDKHLRLVLDFAGQPVYYRDIRKFGGFQLLAGTPGPEAIPHVGPDMLKITFKEWHRRIHQRRAPAKSMLLNQGIAAGLGNIYADEALFSAGIHPASKPVDLTREQLKSLLRESKRILRLAIRHGGTTFQDFVDFTGRPGNFRNLLQVYGRVGESCPTCNAPVEKIKLGGRSTHFCPRCQEPPA